MAFLKYLLPEGGYLRDQIYWSEMIDKIMAIDMTTICSNEKGVSLEIKWETTIIGSKRNDA